MKSLNSSHTMRSGLFRDDKTSKNFWLDTNDDPNISDLKFELKSLKENLSNLDLDLVKEKKRTTDIKIRYNTFNKFNVKGSPKSRVSLSESVSTSPLRKLHEVNGVYWSSKQGTALRIRGMDDGNKLSHTKHSKGKSKQSNLAVSSLRCPLCSRKKDLRAQKFAELHAAVVSCADCATCATELERRVERDMNALLDGDNEIYILQQDLKGFTNKLWELMEANEKSSRRVSESAKEGGGISRESILDSLCGNGVQNLWVELQALCKKYEVSVGKSGQSRTDALRAWTYDSRGKYERLTNEIIWMNSDLAKEKAAFENLQNEIKLAYSGGSENNYK